MSDNHSPNAVENPVVPVKSVKSVTPFKVAPSQQAVTGPVTIPPTAGKSRPEPTPAQLASRFQPGEQLGMSRPGVGGRPRSIVRQAAQLALAERIPILCDIIDGKPIKFSSLVKKKLTAGPNKEALQDEPSSRTGPEGEHKGKEIWENHPANDTYSKVEGYVTAKIDERIKAMEALMKISGVTLPLSPEEENGEQMLDANGNPVKTVRFVITSF